MANDYSLPSLLLFADYLSEKGLLNKNTATARRAACSKVFGVLDKDEASDLRKIDIDQVAMRFNNLEGSKYSPDSLRVYKSRASSTLEDFFRYKKNPAAFRIETPVRKPKVGSESTQNAQQSENSIRSIEKGQESKVAGVNDINTIDIPIPIRSGCIVYVNGLPTDLSREEAEKIGNVVAAMAVSRGQ